MIRNGRARIAQAEARASQRQTHATPGPGFVPSELWWQELWTLIDTSPHKDAIVAVLHGLDHPHSGGDSGVVSDG
jgi:hypothetical protein